MTDEVILMPGAGEVATAGERDLALSEETLARIEAGVPENTRAVMVRRWAEFVRWCEHELRTPLPATRETLAEYVSFVVSQPTQRDQPVAPRSVEQIIAVIRTVHREAGYAGQPDTGPALKVLRGYRREQADSGRRDRRATPITIEALRAMVEHTPGTTAGMRDRLLLVLGWSMMARRSELVALNLSDLVETEDGLEVHIRSSKTDQDAKGRQVNLPWGQFPETCPVRLMRAWRRELAEFDVTEGRVFRSINRWGQLGESLSPRFVNEVVQQAAERAQLPNPSGYSAHSLRAGGATQAARNGVPVSVIAEHGRWSTTSPVVLGYIRAVDRWKDNPMRGIGL